MLDSKTKFLEDSTVALGKIYDNIIDKKDFNLRDLESKNAALVIVDVINGFVREGALKSDRVEKIISPVVKLINSCDDLGIEKIAFLDNHSEDSVEFECFPCHCISGSSEAQLVDEIMEAGNYELFHKNSTNGFLEEKFQQWLKQNENITNFIVVGDCTDICVLQFALTLKTYFNNKNIKSRIIIPIDAVETYDFDDHNAELVNAMSLQLMMWSGIEVVKQITVN